MKIPMIEPTAEPEPLRAVFQQLRETRGRVPGMYRTLAHQPAVLAAHRAYFHAALDTGDLPRAFKERVAYRVARLRGSEYSSASHRSYALKHGASTAELEAIDRSEYQTLEPRLCAALELANSMVSSHGAVAGPVSQRLRAHFTTAEIVELIALIGVMELACTLGTAFELDAD